MDQSILKDVLADLGRPVTANDSVEIPGSDPVLPTRFRIGEAAASVLAGCGLLASDLWRHRTGRSQSVRVEVTPACASLLSFAFLESKTLETERIERPTVAFHQAGDGGWVHLHGGFPHLRDGLLDLLRCTDDFASVGKAVENWQAQSLEEAIAERRLCGARVRTFDEWKGHPQGIALASAPLVEIERIADGPPMPLNASPPLRPLSGIRVLDLTRVLAGPTCARTLAEHGADVLRIGSPQLPHIAPFVLDTGHGKRNAFLDLNDPRDSATLRELVRRADVFSQGYRGGSMAARGLGPEELAALRPGIVAVSINCYGHEGPWASRAGWEQLAQTVTGIACEQRGEDGVPRLLPAAATDYTTGYLAALGSMRALTRRAQEGGSYHVKVSLARTGMWLASLGRADGSPSGLSKEALEPWRTVSQTDAGPLGHMAPVLWMSETAPRWERAVSPLGTHRPEWTPIQPT